MAEDIGETITTIKANYCMVIGDEPHSVKFCVFKNRPNLLIRFLQWLFFRIKWQEFKEF